MILPLLLIPSWALVIAYRLPMDCLWPRSLRGRASKVFLTIQPAVTALETEAVAQFAIGSIAIYKNPPCWHKVKNSSIEWQK